MPTPPVGPAADPGPLALKLDLLFRVRLRPAVKGPRDRLVQHTLVTVARAAGSTTAYISQLRSGRRKNPGIQKLRGIAEIFGIDVAYLVDDAIPVEAWQQYLVDRDRHDTADIAVRVNLLFTTFLNGARQYTSQEVAQGVGVAVEQLQRLREGTLDDPGLRLLQSVATFFGVNPAYLTSSDPQEIERIQQQIDVVGLPFAARGLVATGSPDPQTLELLRAILQMVGERDGQVTGHRADPPEAQQ